ncbi:MAG: O-antigen ligase family protein [Candidatus Eremiobacteraeota bacterium]|nr:O-antigen ligase family protein [Candidatus Eremiobacteraeota bacterium]
MSDMTSLSMEGATREAQRGETMTAMRKLGIAFLIGIAVIDWGRVAVHLSSQITFTLGGTARNVMIPLFLVFCFMTAFKKRRALSTKGLGPLAAFCGYAGLSILWSRGYDFWFFVNMIVPGFLALLMARALMEEDRGFLWGKLLPVFCLGPLLIVARGLIDSPGHLLSMGELDSPFEQHTLIAMNLLFMIPLIVARLIDDKGRMSFYGIALVLTIMGVVLCGSRVGLVTLVLVIVLLIGSFASKQTRLIGAGALVLVVVFFLAFPVTHQRFVGLLSLGDDPYLITRTRIWDMTWDFTKEHLLLGVGFSPDTFRALGAGRFGSDMFFYEHPHNVVLQVLSFLGIPGLVLFGWLAVSTGKKVAAIIRSAEGEEGHMGKALAVSFLGFLFMNLVEGGFNSCRMMLTLFIGLALVEYLVSLQAAAGGGDEALRAPPRECPP